MSMSGDKQSTNTTDLASYLLAQLDDWEKNRQDLEDKWEANRQAYRARRDEDVDEKTWKKSEKKNDWQSDTFFDIERQKVISSIALIYDVMFRSDSVPFDLVETDETPTERAEKEAEIQVVESEAVASQKTLIQRQMQNCNAVKHLKKCATSGAVYGEYWGKRYTTDMRVQDGFVPVYGEDGIFEERVEAVDAPGFEYKPVWNMFWDMEAPCMDEGRGVYERDYIPASKARKRMGLPLHDDKRIMDVIKEHETKVGSNPEDDNTSLPPRLRDRVNRINNIRLVEYHGLAPRKFVESFEQDWIKPEDDSMMNPQSQSQELQAEDSGDDIEVFAVIMDDKIIAFSRAEQRDRPYFREFWVENLDDDGGISICDAVQPHGIVLRGAIRTLEDNKKLASRLILGVKERFSRDDLIEQLNTDEPVVMLRLTEEARSIQDMIQHYVVPDIGRTVMEIIPLFMEFADMSSHIPRVQQGQQSANAQTAFEVAQRLDRSGKYIGMVIQNLDKFISKIVASFYRENMLDPDLRIPKANMTVKATGFTMFDNKVLRLQRLMSLLQIFMSNESFASRANLDWLITEIIRANDIDPDKALKSPEMVQQEQQAPNPAAELEMADRAAEVRKKNADAQAKETKAVVEAEKLKLERFNTISEAEKSLFGQQ